MPFDRAKTPVLCDVHVYGQIWRLFDEAIVAELRASTAITEIEPANLEHQKKYCAETHAFKS